MYRQRRQVFCVRTLFLSPTCTLSHMVRMHETMEQMAWHSLKTK